MQYLIKHGKSYGTREEYEFRFGQFRESLGKIHEHNSRNDVTYRLGLNIFSDLTKDEFLRMIGYQPHPRDTKNVQILDYDEDMAPEAIDWRKQGAVNHVKD